MADFNLPSFYLYLFYLLHSFILLTFLFSAFKLNIFNIFQIGKLVNFAIFTLCVYILYTQGLLFFRKMDIVLSHNMGIMTSIIKIRKKSIYNYGISMFCFLFAFLCWVISYNFLFNFLCTWCGVYSMNFKLLIYHSYSKIFYHCNVKL